ncbi:MAG: hypothetical protein KIC90_04580 [Firmicutes bacterium]|jgi:hypothetical protein|nr:hypothetical protein [Bacillota bacterium]CDE07925.1 unknown [Bacillus sp. CAG:988]
MNQDKVISDYCKMRDELLINFEKISDSELLQKLLELNGENIPSSPEVARIGLHKARLYSNNIPIELKEKSKKWLLDNNYDLEIY